MSKKINRVSVKQVDPLAGKPRTERVEDEDGLPAILIHFREITPLREKWARGLATFSAIAMTLTGPLFVVGMHKAGLLGTGAQPPGELLLGMLVGPWVLLPVIRIIFRALLKKAQKVMVTMDSLRVLRNGHWDKLQRSQIGADIHSIAHDKLLAEEDHLLEMRSEGKSIKKKRFYSQSYHIIATHARQRYDLFEVYGEKAAQRDAERITAAIWIMDDLRARAAQLPIRPMHNQTLEHMPGQIPEHVPGQIPEEV